jgi:hypothetical protein
MKRLRLLASLPALGVAGATGFAALVLSDVDYFANRIAAKIAGTDES